MPAAEMLFQCQCLPWRSQFLGQLSLYRKLPENLQHALLEPQSPLGILHNLEVRVAGPHAASRQPLQTRCSVASTRVSWSLQGRAQLPKTSIH